MAIKAIFIDFYGTIVHEDSDTMLKNCHKIKENSNSEASVLDIGHFWMKEFNRLLMTSQGEKFIKQRELISISLDRTLSHFNSKVNKGELLEAMFNHWKQPTIFTDAIEFFEKNTLPVYILSNIDHLDITEAMSQLALKVDGVITSEDVKAYKPFREMFDHALNLTGLSPEEVLHVGDSLVSDVSGANLVGINSVWVNRNNKEITADNKPTLIIKNLNEVVNISALLRV